MTTGRSARRGWLRRTTLAASAVLLVAAGGSVPAGATVPNVETSVAATWYVPMGRPGHYRFFSVNVQREEPVGRRATTDAEVNRGTCTKSGPGGESAMSCMGSAFFVEPDEFRFDPLTSSAYLQIDTKELHVSIYWTPTLDYAGAYRAGEPCSDIEGRGIVLYRPAVARGTMFGRHLETRGDYDNANVQRGVTVRPCADPFVLTSSTGG